MRTLKRFFKRLTSWTTTRQDEERMQQEIEDHLALQTAENVRRGLSPDEARRQALLKFGGVEVTRENCREQRGVPSLENLLRDTRYASRRLRKAPAFTLATVLTLALGIGATTSIFTLVHAVILKSLAVANPDQLYRLGKESRCCYYGGYSQEREFSLVSYDLYKHLRDNAKGFSELAAFSATDPSLGVRRKGAVDAAQTYPGEFVSGNYFVMFGVNAYAGRMLSAQDDQPGAPPVAVMSYRLWQQRYAADPSIIGGVFNLNDKPFTIVGITPPAFFGDTLRNNPPDFFLPLNTEPFAQNDTDLLSVDNHWLDVIGRISPGASPATVQAGMRIALQQWLRAHWGMMTANDQARFPRQTLNLVPGGAGITTMREAYERWLQILMTVSGFVLLIVCANVANLMLARGIEQRKQTALSMALGARPSRLMRQALSESLLLSFLGGAAGLAIAFAGTRLILHFAFPPTPGALGGIGGIPISATPSMPVLLFAFGVSLVTGLVFGLAPALMASRVDPIEALRGAGRSTARTGSLSRKTLVVVQAALSLVLLSSAGLLTAALHSLENQGLGFEQDRRIVAHINPRLGGYRPDQLTPLYQRIHDSLAALPDVSAVALCTYSPLGGNIWGAGVLVDGHRPPGPRDDNSAAWDRVTAGYFGVVGNAILKGRGITGQDTSASSRVAVINQAFARKFFPNQDPLGKHFGQHGVGTERDYEIVGIAADARYMTFKLDRPVGAMFFLPASQHDFLPGPKATEASPGAQFLQDVIIVTRPGASLSSARLHQAITSIDPNLPLLSIHSLREQVAGQFIQQRLIARLTSFFGILSLILASVGLYGVTAYNAERRFNEIGVRMALGATRGHVVTLVLKGACGLMLVGLLLGMPAALVAGRLLGNQLYGMSPYNPMVILAAIVVLAISALLASLIPAFRASFISPSDALRAE